MNDLSSHSVPSVSVQSLDSAIVDSSHSLGAVAIIHSKDVTRPSDMVVWGGGGVNVFCDFYFYDERRFEFAQLK